MFDQSLPLVLPVGTQIVSEVELHRADGSTVCTVGAVGIIIKQPVDHTHAYRIRFMDGTETALHRRDFAVRRHFQFPTAPNSDQLENDLRASIIYRCITGSRAYGLDNDESDTDWRGIYLPPAELHWSLSGVPEQIEHDGNQEVYWELEKFILLALKANPNILECLYTPLVDFTTPLAEELLEMRQIFLSRLIYQTYNGYVLSQFKKLNHHLEQHGTIKWKHAMHLIRLLLSGIIALQDGVIPVRVDQYRDELLSIRTVQMTWDDINNWRVDLHQQFDAAFQRTALPERPDYDKANAFLLRARRSMVK